MNRTMLLLCLCLLPHLALSIGERTKKEAYPTLKELGPSLGYRPPPALVRRDAVSRVDYDPEKWTSEPSMTISGGIMFDRQTGLSVKECLSKCARPEFQNPANRWVCRSLTYDHKWSICDLFAITGDAPPYFLSEYKHRDYFRYLAALPPSDVEFKVNASREMSAEVQAEEQKFESTSTTTASSLAKDTNTTPPPSTLITLPEPLPVEASKAPLEEISAFSPVPVIDNALGKLDVKEDAAKALASKSTGDATAVVQEKEIVAVEEKKPKVEYYRKPTLKFAITPIKRVEEVQKIEETPKIEATPKIEETPKEVPKIAVVEEIATISTEQPKNVEEFFISTEQPKNVEPSAISTELPTAQPIEQATTESSSETTTKPTSFVQEEPTTNAEIVHETTAKEIQTQEKSISVAALEEPKPVEIADEAGPVFGGRRTKVPKKKIQGITTYTAQNNGDTLKNGGCKLGEIPRFIQVKKHGRVAELAKKVDASKVEDCVVACINEGSFVCNSAVFSQSSCSLFTDIVDHGASHSLNKDDDSSYLERICVPERLAHDDKIIYEAIRNYILVGQVQEVTDAQTLAKCQVDCLTASENLGFTCKSAMFYPTDVESGQNCLLNAEDHESKSDSFVSEDANVNMIYFAIGQPAEHKKLGINNFKRLDSPIKRDETGWTKWSKCKHDVIDSIRHRYLKCSYVKDIRKCPKQSAMCKPPSLQIRKLEKPENDCRAVRDSRGNKRCPHGVRYDQRGVRHYCIHPMDC